MRFCEQCGFELPNQEAKFCRNCGAALAHAEEVPERQAAPEGAEEIPQRQTFSGPAPQTAPEPSPQTAASAGLPVKKNKTNLVLACIVAFQVVAVVVLALLLAFGSGGANEGEAAAGDHKDHRLALAEEYVRAWEKEDIEAYLACMDPSRRTQSEFDEFEELIVWVFEGAEVRMVDLEFEVNETGKDRAEVVAVGGTLEVLVEGETTTIDFSEDPVTLKMINIGGSWYMTEDPAFELAENILGY